VAIVNYIIFSSLRPIEASQGRVVAAIVAWMLPGAEKIKFRNNFWQISSESSKNYSKFSLGLLQIENNSPKGRDNIEFTIC
jgi:hypothetical protein